MAAKFLGEAPVEAARAWVAHISEVGVRDATPGLPWPRSIGKPYNATENMAGLCVVQWGPKNGPA